MNKCCRNILNLFRASNMAQQVKVPVAKKDFSQISVIQTLLLEVDNSLQLAVL